MQESTKNAIESIAKKSFAGELTFGDVVGALINLGVESYFSDYRTGKITYYLSGGETAQIDLGHKGQTIPMEFSADKIKAAILAAQRDEIRYPQFIAASIAAGCIGYIVWIAGRHVTYFGRCGEQHDELFPNQG